VSSSASPGGGGEEKDKLNPINDGVMRDGYSSAGTCERKSGSWWPRYVVEIVRSVSPSVPVFAVAVGVFVECCGCDCGSRIFATAVQKPGRVKVSITCTSLSVGAVARKNDSASARVGSVRPSSSVEKSVNECSFGILEARVLRNGGGKPREKSSRVRCVIVWGRVGGGGSNVPGLRWIGW